MLGGKGIVLKAWDSSFSVVLEDKEMLAMTT